MKNLSEEIRRLESYVERGQANKALVGYEQLLSQMPNDPVLRNRVSFLRDSLHRHAPKWQVQTYVISVQAVAEAHIMANRYAEALEILEGLLEKDPNDAGLARRVGMVRAMRDGTFDAGIEPTASTHLMTPGMIVEAHIAAGDIEAALRVLKALCERRPDNLDLHQRYDSLLDAWKGSSSHNSASEELQRPQAPGGRVVEHPPPLPGSDLASAAMPSHVPQYRTRQLEDLLQDARAIIEQNQSSESVPRPIVRTPEVVTRAREKTGRIVDVIKRSEVQAASEPEPQPAKGAKVDWPTEVSTVDDFYDDEETLAEEAKPQTAAQRDATRQRETTRQREKSALTPIVEKPKDIRKKLKLSEPVYDSPMPERGPERAHDGHENTLAVAPLPTAAPAGETPKNRRPFSSLLSSQTDPAPERLMSGQKPAVHPPPKVSSGQTDRPPPLPPRARVEGVADADDIIESSAVLPGYVKVKSRREKHRRGKIAKGSVRDLLAGEPIPLESRLLYSAEAPASSNEMDAEAFDDIHDALTEMNQQRRNVFPPGMTVPTPATADDYEDMSTIAWQQKRFPQTRDAVMHKTAAKPNADMGREAFEERAQKSGLALPAQDSHVHRLENFDDDDPTILDKQSGSPFDEPLEPFAVADSAEKPSTEHHQTKRLRALMSPPKKR